MSGEPEYNNTSTINSQLVLDPITEEEDSSCIYDDERLNIILAQNMATEHEHEHEHEHDNNISVVETLCIGSGDTNIDIRGISIGYNYDIVLTYKMIEDEDDQDELFRLQFLQAFGITNDDYQPDIVSRELDVLYSRYRDNPKIQEILRSHPLYHRETRGGEDGGGGNDNDRSDSSSLDNGENSVDENISVSEDGTSITMNTDNSEMIFCMMFSFQTFDLFHMCLQDIFYGRDIRNDIIEQIAVLHQNMF